MLRRFIMTAAAAVAMACFVPSTSQAAFTLTLTDSNGNYAGYTNLANGQQVSGTLDNVQFKGVAEFTNSPGSPSGILSFVGSFTIAQPGSPDGAFLTSSLTINAFSDGFTAPPAATTVVTYGSVTGATVPYSSTVVVTNGSQTAGYGSTATSGTGSSSFYASSGSFGIPPSGYAISDTLTISTIIGSNTVSFSENGVVAPSPVPAGLALILTAVPFAGVIRRRVGRKA